MQTTLSEPGLSRTAGKGRLLLWLLLPFLVLVLAHTLIALARNRPLIFADEAGYLGNARFLAGGLPIKMFNAGAYYPGYSLLLVPLYWMGLTPAQTYQLALILNGALLSTAYLSLVGWMRWVVGDRSKYAYGIAFVVSLYPTFLIQPTFAMSESAVIAVATFLPLLCYWLVASRRFAVALAFAVLTAFLYAIHPRFIGTVAAAVLIAGVAGLLRTLGICAVILTWGVLGAGVLGTQALTAHIKSINGGGGSNGAERLAHTLTSADRLGAVLVEALGQFWYLEVGTAGLVFVGLVELLKRLLAPTSDRRWKSPSWVALLFTLLCTALAFGASSTFLSSPRRVDHFIYGRYNECVLAPILAAGLWALVNAGKSWRKHALNAGLVAATLLVTAAVLISARGDAWFGPKNLANIIAIIPLIRLASGMHLLALSLVALGAFAIISLSSRWRPWLALVLTSAGFIASTTFAFRTFINMQKGRARRQAVFDHAARLSDLDQVGYDVAYKDPAMLFFGQYFLPNTEFVFFDSSRGEAPYTNYFFGTQRWDKAKSLAGQLIATDKHGFSLWSAKRCCKPLEAFSSSGDFGLADGFIASGFYPAEEWSVGTVRWTDGAALVTAPLGKDDFATSNLYVDIASVGPVVCRLSIAANGKDLFEGKITKGRSRLVLPLAAVPDADALVLNIRSTTFVPAEKSNSTDGRQLGIALRSLAIVPECCVAGRDPFIRAE